MDRGTDRQTEGLPEKTDQIDRATDRRQERWIQTIALRQGRTADIEETDIGTDRYERRRHMDRRWRFYRQKIEGQNKHSLIATGSAE